MKRRTMGSLCMTVLSCALWAGGMAGADAGAVDTTVTDPAHRHNAGVLEAMTVDGDLSEWPWEPAREIAIHTDTFRLSPPPVRSRADCSGVVQFAWDGKGRYLYVAAKVRDQSLVALAKPDDMPWKCDSLMVSIHAHGAMRERSNLVKTTPWADHPLFGLSYYTDKTGPRKWTPDTRYAVKATEDGYTIEAALALKDVGYDARHGDKLKFSLILVDHDADGKFAQLAQDSEGGFSFWWDLRLRDAKPYAGGLITSQRSFGPDPDVGFMGEIDAFADGLVLKALRLKTHDGRIVAALPAAKPLTAGRRTLVSGRFGSLKLGAGDYTVVAVITQAGRESDGEVHGKFRIVKSVESETGVVGKLPDRYMVPDPKRYTFYSKRREYKPRKVTREDYIKLVQHVFTEKYSAYYKKGREASVGMWGVFSALPAYALYKYTGDKQYLETGLGFLQHGHEANAKQTPAIHWPTQYRIVELYLNDPTVPEKDKVWLREFIPRVIASVWEKSRPEEWGAMNRSLMWAEFLDIAAKLLPNSPHAPKWKAYAELNWQSWWPYRDHWENSSDYNAGLIEYLSWAAWRDPKHLKDPEVAKLVEREMYEVTPAGAFPGYGDANPWNLSSYARIPLLERMATVTRDGRFKWAARRLFDYADRQMEDLFSWHLIYDGAASNCAWAYLYADDTVAEKQPVIKSRITRRKAFEAVPKDDPLRAELLQKHGITGVYLRMKEGTTLNKLILRAGASPFAPAGMIELCSDAGHHASTVPNLNYLMCERSILLCDLGYTERGPEYHNVVFIEDLTGIAPEARAEVVTVPTLATGAQATYAVVNVDNYKKWPVTNNRRVLFTNDGLVLVKDLVTFRRPFVARVRQQWQTRQITPKAGANWANTNIPWVMNTGLGLGSGYQRWLNPAWDLLVYFTPQAGRDFEVHDRSLENIWQAIPLRISQRYRGLPEKDKPLHFTTLLWPHKPELDVEKYVKRIHVLHDDPSVTAFRVDVTDRRRIYIGINDTGKVRRFGTVKTDAAVFMVACHVSGETVKPYYMFARGVRVLDFNGKSLLKAKEEGDVDRHF